MGPRFPRAADVCNAHVCAMELGAGCALQGSTRRLHQCPDRPAASGCMVTAAVLAWALPSVSGTQGATQMDDQPTATIAAPTPKSWFDRTFELSVRGTSVPQELLAGATTFAAMVYIIAVNPSIMANAGM